MDCSMECICQMWLSAAEPLTPSKRRALLNAYGSAETVFQAFSPDMARIIGDKAYKALFEARARGLLYLPRELLRMGAYTASRKEGLYPALLRDVPDAPELLYVKGLIPAAPAVAIVGSRHDTRYGRQMAQAIACELSRAGVTIISGLARGIDTAAHIGALRGGGKTVAVLGSGFSEIYPPENKQLAENIVLEGGALVSEYPVDATPMPYHFPLRNRIISGLSNAVLLIEATLRSGTMSTVNHALSQGRPVFALPGNVDAPGSELPLKLLKEGAGLCTCAQDILDALKIPHADAKKTSGDEPSTDDPILLALAREEKTFEELLEATGLTLDELGARLSMLEMDGAVEKRPGRAYALAAKK